MDAAVHGVITITTGTWTSSQLALINPTRFIAITGMAPLPMSQRKQGLRTREAVGVHCSQIMTTTVTQISISRVAVGLGQAENTLYHNNADGTFTDVTHAAGVADPQSSFCAAWADYDNDGYIDLYIADGVIGDGAANVLYRNNRDGTFTNTAESAGVANTGNSLGTAWGDYDKDGYIDLHVVNYGQSNVLYRNNGDGTFTDVTATTGMNLPITDAFVTFFLDVDNDADLDIFISNSGSFQAFIAGQITGTAPHDGDRQVLYRNNGDGTFTDVTRESGLYHAFGAMGANFEDIDSDGYLDIYLATGAPQMGRLERDALFRQ